MWFGAFAANPATPLSCAGDVQRPALLISSPPLNRGGLFLAQDTTEEPACPAAQPTYVTRKDKRLPRRQPSVRHKDWSSRKGPGCFDSIKSREFRRNPERGLDVQIIAQRQKIASPFQAPMRRRRAAARTAMKSGAKFRGFTQASHISSSARTTENSGWSEGSANSEERLALAARTKSPSAEPCWAGTSIQADSGIDRPQWPHSRVAA